MSLRTHAFTASGLLHAASQDNEVWGLTYKGFTSVVVYNGLDNTGSVILAGGAGPLTLSLIEGVEAEKGIFVEVVGSGSGSLLY